MGGPGSGRWHEVITRGTTDGLLRLDVRWLARQGYLTAPPGTEATGAVVWSRDGQEAARIALAYRGDEPEALLLRYEARLPGGAAHPIRSRIGLARTPCRYGGTRPWFRCPGCGGRRAVLYEVAGRFRCRACHHLAHASTRVRRAPQPSSAV